MSIFILCLSEKPTKAEAGTLPRIVEGFGSGRSNVGRPSERLEPDFSFRLEIHGQEATAASMATAAMMAML